MSHTYQKYPLLPKANPPKSSHQVYEEPFTSHMHTQKRIVGNKCWCDFCSSLVRNCDNKTTLTKMSLQSHFWWRSTKKYRLFLIWFISHFFTMTTMDSKTNRTQGRHRRKADSMKNKETGQFKKTSIVCRLFNFFLSSSLFLMFGMVIKGHLVRASAVFAFLWQLGSAASLWLTSSRGSSHVAHWRPQWFTITSRGTRGIKKKDWPQLVG